MSRRFSADSEPRKPPYNSGEAYYWGSGRALAIVLKPRIFSSAFMCYTYWTRELPLYLVLASPSLQCVVSCLQGEFGRPSKWGSVDLVQSGGGCKEGSPGEGPESYGRSICESLLPTHTLPSDRRHFACQPASEGKVLIIVYAGRVVLAQRGGRRCEPIQVIGP